MTSTGNRSVRIRRLREGKSMAALDRLAVEEPLEIRINNQPLSITMRTPGQDAELAAGFLFAEGVIRSASDIPRMEPHPRNRAGNVLNVTLAGDTLIDWAKLKRHFAASSSCGLCGRENIAAVRRRWSRIRSQITVCPSVLQALPERLRGAQPIFASTGGLHAAGLFDPDGRLLVAREDIGRHNAVDKVLGWGLRTGNLPFDRHILVVSGRASFEIVQKALAAGVPVLCAVSAPSSLAVDLARSAGMTLIGFLRDRSMNVYCGAQRVKE